MFRPVKPPFLYRMLHSRLTWQMPAGQKLLYLTFDDGPVPGVTDKVLESLARYGAKGTFFCVGRNVEENPAIYNRIKKAGHATGNHTFHHLNGWNTDDKLYFESTERARAFVPSPLFRPPYGKIRRSQIRMLVPRYRIIMWDVLSYDFDPVVSKEASLKKVIQHAGDGSIVVFHDSVKAAEKLTWVLPRVLEHFSGKGYRFEAIG